MDSQAQNKLRRQDKKSKSRQQWGSSSEGQDKKSKSRQQWGSCSEGQDKKTKSKEAAGWWRNWGFPTTPQQLKANNHTEAMKNLGIFTTDGTDQDLLHVVLTLQPKTYIYNISTNIACFDNQSESGSI